MRITVVTETYWPEINGVAMTLHRLTNGLASMGHHVQLVCPHHKERNVTELSSNISYNRVIGIPIPGYGEANFGLPSNKVLKNLWTRSRPDVIYVATEGPLGWTAIKEANKAGIPVVSGFHTNFHSYSKHYKLGFMEKMVEQYLTTLHNKTRTTLVPTLEQKSMLESMGIHDVSVMGRGVDTELFSPQKRDLTLRQQWGAESQDPVMIYVGRIAEEKNLDLMIKTYYVLREINHKLKLVLVGDGPLSKKLKKEHPAFIFTGNLKGEELARHYASGDIFAFTSMTETFGNVVQEAMASGLAVIAYDYAAAKLNIRDGENGILAKFNDEDEFIKKASLAFQNDIQLKKIRGNACQDIQQNAWHAIIEQFDNILASHSIQQKFSHADEIEVTQRAS